MEENVNQVIAEGTEANSDDISFDDVLSIKEYQSEFDKRVSKAIETAKGKWTKEAEAKRNEAEKLAQMNSDEKHKYELDKVSKDRDEALGKLNAYELKEQAIKIANEEGLNVSLLDLIDFKRETADTLNDKIKTLKNTFNKAVEGAINDRLKEKAPQQVNSNKPNKKNVTRYSI